MNDINLMHGDCLERMKEIPDGSVDMILCDLPYGVIKRMRLSGWEKDDTHWDVRIDTNKLFREYERVLRNNGKAVVFSQEPYTSHLRNSPCYNMNFLYPLIYKKENFANFLNVSNAPVSYFEDISVFSKVYDSKRQSPLRDYARKIFEFIGIRRSKYEGIIEGRGAVLQHFFDFEGLEFSLPAKDAYEVLIEKYHIDDMNGFRTYGEMLEEQQQYRQQYRQQYPNIFNIPYGKFVSNVLEFKKDAEKLHPTQKPVALCEYLILVYTDENDVVLDNCMGSGTTGVACVNTKRKFIGIEKEQKYFEVAQKRIKDAQAQLTLF